MDMRDLFQCCRTGDFTKVKYLIEMKEVELNVRDKWDSTPLYYACLCGHRELVEFLLENGAKCEANTFDGERCLYGALSNEIRKLLKNYKAVTSHSLRRDNYQEFLRRILESRGSWEDVHFVVEDQVLAAHKCILCARSSYFAEMFKTRRADRDTIPLKKMAQVEPEVFRAVLQYLYTDRLELHLDHVEGCLWLANKFKLAHLKKDIEDALIKTDSYVSSKPGISVTIISVEPCLDSSLSRLQEDFGLLAKLTIPPQVFTWGELPFVADEKAPYADICFSVDGCKFYCHKVFFCGRSDYFKALVSDHFCEAATIRGEEDCRDLPIIPLRDISPLAFVKVLYYLYTDTAELSLEMAYEVLVKADMYLLPGLKRKCATTIGQHLDEANVVGALHTARLFALARLEDQCAEFMATIVDKLVANEDFRELVRSDASGVKERQETDSIPIVDDVRYHITSSVQTYSELQDANDKLDVLDQLLLQLDIEC